MKHFSFLIVAGGSGSRIGGERKQFRLLGGRPLWRCSADLAASLWRDGIAEVVLVLPRGEVAPQPWPEAGPVPLRLAEGGASRPESVMNGKTRVAGDEVAVRNGSGAAAVPSSGAQRAASTPAATQAQTRAASPGGSAVPGTANVAMPASTPASAPAASSSDPYSRGMSQYNGRQYKEAYKSFEKALAANPNGSKAADTLYHMGESLFNQGEYDLAILDYQKVISNHASSALASKALLKQGMSFEKLTDNETAKIIYRKLLSDYKQSPEASQAQERLNKL